MSVDVLSGKASSNLSIITQKQDELFMINSFKELKILLKSTKVLALSFGVCDSLKSLGVASTVWIVLPSGENVLVNENLLFLMSK